MNPSITLFFHWEQQHVNSVVSEQNHIYTLCEWRQQLKWHYINSERLSPNQGLKYRRPRGLEQRGGHVVWEEGATSSLPARGRRALTRCNLPQYGAGQSSGKISSHIWWFCIRVMTFLTFPSRVRVRAPEKLTGKFDDFAFVLSMTFFVLAGLRSQQGAQASVGGAWGWAPPYSHPAL